MNTGLWILQGVLAFIFGMAGVMKSSQPIKKLAARMPWVNDYSPGTVRFVGISELLGAIGLVVPLASGIFPILTPLAAVGLAVIMMLAMRYHISKKEYKETAMNTVLLLLCIVVAYFRFRPGGY